MEYLRFGAWNLVFYTQPFEHVQKLIVNQAKINVICHTK